VVAALAAMAGGEPRPWPRHEAFARGEAVLREATASVFGPAREGRPVRILVTCPTEAADDPAFMEGVARAGAEAVRINRAHDGPEAWGRMVANLRAAEAATGRRLRVLMDLGGPKVRTGEVRTPADRERLGSGDRLLLVRPGGLDEAPDDAPAFRAECAEPGALGRLREGEPVLVDDGKVRGEIERVGPGGALVRIGRAPPGGAKLKPEKGLNFPESELDLPPLGPDDLADLDFVAANADLVGYSFVQSAGDVALLQEELRRRRPDDWARLGIVAKVETPRAVRNLPEIVVAAAGRQPLAVMIARGDLAVEIGFVRLAEMQEEIMWLCEAARVPVVWATQVLEGLVKKGLPSRGEMTDAAMAARAECVMLNKGPYLVEAVEALDRILSRMSEHQTKKTPRLRALRAW
jgi:pyruvate kinase